MATKNYTLHVKADKYPAVIEHLEKQENVSAYILDLIMQDAGVETTTERLERLEQEVKELRQMLAQLQEPTIIDHDNEPLRASFDWEWQI